MIPVKVWQVELGNSWSDRMCHFSKLFSNGSRNYHLLEIDNYKDTDSEFLWMPPFWFSDWIFATGEEIKVGDFFLLMMCFAFIWLIGWCFQIRMKGKSDLKSFWPENAYLMKVKGVVNKNVPHFHFTSFVRILYPANMYILEYRFSWETCNCMLLYIWASLEIILSAS